MSKENLDIINKVEIKHLRKDLEKIDKKFDALHKQMTDSHNVMVKKIDDMWNKNEDRFVSKREFKKFGLIASAILIAVTKAPDIVSPLLDVAKNLI